MEGEAARRSRRTSSRGCRRCSRSRPWPSGSRATASCSTSTPRTCASSATAAGRSCTAGRCSSRSRPRTGHESWRWSSSGLAASRRSSRASACSPGGVAHDFNNILTVIANEVTLAKLEASTGPAFTAHLDAIALAAERAADLCRQMLAYAGKARFAREAVDLSALVAEMSSMLQVSIAKTLERAPPYRAGAPRRPGKRIRRRGARGRPPRAAARRGTGRGAREAVPGGAPGRHAAAGDGDALPRMKIRGALTKGALTRRAARPPAPAAGPCGRRARRTSLPGA